MDSLIVFLPILLFFVFFPLLWCGVIFLVAQIGGWAQLAQVYRFDRKFRGQSWSMQSAAMRWGCSYNSVLTFGANDEGLYIVPLIFFRFAHPPLFIPWYDLSVMRINGIFWYAQLRFQRTPSIPVKINRRLFERLAGCAGEAWTEEG